MLATHLRRLAGLDGDRVSMVQNDLGSGRIQCHDHTQGGSPTRGKRKSARPFSPHLPLHLVLRSSRAKGALSFRDGRHHEQVDQQIRRSARRHQVKLHKHANVGNHLHLLIECRTKERYRAFIRELSGRLVQIVTKARKGSAVGRGFFDSIPFSRIVTRGRDFEAVVKYIIKNALEGAGLIRRAKGIKDPELLTIRSYIPKVAYDDWPELKNQLGFT